MKPNIKPRFVGANRSLQNNQRLNFTRKNLRRQLDRSLLPTPANYYSKQFPNSKIKSEWVNVRCCFHSPDNNPSLSLNMVDGHFKCHACDKKGCDVIDFHQLRYGLSFTETVNYFGAWSHE